MVEQQSGRELGKAAANEWLGGYTLVDLSQPIYDGMPVYRGHLPTRIWTHVTHEQTAERFLGGFSFQTRGLEMCDHGPTHVDAINHFDPSPDAPGIDEMPLDAFFGTGACLDVSSTQPGGYITAAALDEAAAAAATPIEPGMVLLLHTGTFERLGGTADYSEQYPGLDGDASKWLERLRLKCFGVDSPSPDSPTSRTYPCHMMCRANGLHHYENLANLRGLIGRRFLFAGFPLAIRQGTGSPARAVAIVPN